MPALHQGVMTTLRTRILVVDDNEDSRQMMAMLLAADGYEVDQASSALDGLRCLQAKNYALVLTDYHMPDRTGVWMLEQAQQRDLLDGAITMVVTADYDAAELMNDPTVVRKPVDFTRFLPQLRAMLASDEGAAKPPAPDQGDRLPRPAVVFPETRIELILYVTAESIPCHRAKAAMTEILAEYDASSVDFRVYDLESHLAAAQRDRIIFTPTLVKRWPDPKVWVVGDLTRRAVVIDLLEMAGLSPNTST
jgi:two-component system response regulator GlrR